MVGSQVREVHPLGRILSRKRRDFLDDYDAWVELARAADQKWIVFTTKHHDGFCMFDSSFTDYKITRGPYKKDVLRMLLEARRRSHFERFSSNMIRGGEHLIRA